MVFDAGFDPYQSTRLADTMLASELGRIMQRRKFISLLGGAAAWPLAARAQQPAVPVAAFLSALSQGQTSHLVSSVEAGLE
jgi:putative ABC transport system substrate-binding protein